MPMNCLELVRVISKLIKIESFQEDQSLLNIRRGDILEGYFIVWPVVGYNFYLLTDKCGGGGSIATTTVTEIINDRTFKTKNSIYKIVTLEDERDEKIKIILL